MLQKHRCTPAAAFLCSKFLFLLLFAHSAVATHAASAPVPPPCSDLHCNSSLAALPLSELDNSTDFIVVLKENMAMRVLQAMCNTNHTAFLQFASKHDISSDCHLGGFCRHVFNNHILGLAGSFSQGQLTDLKRCLPDDCIDYIEEDVKVYKTEGPRPSLHTLPTHTHSKNRGDAHRARALLGSAPPESSTSKHSSKKPSTKRAEEQDGSASGPTTDPVLIQLQQQFMPASSNMQQSGISTTDFAAPTNGLTTITAGYLPGSSTSPSQSTVQAANGPDPQAQGTSDGTLLMANGLKNQHLHSAQWNLDRLDQVHLPLNQSYRFGSASTVGSGRGVTIYTLDSGIHHSHQEFQPWQGNMQRVSLGPSFASDSKDASDCDGHGTHIGSTAVGRVVGVAKEASLVAVRVLDCKGAGQVSDVVAGLEWVGLNHKLPAVVTMSLGVQAGQWSQTLQSAVTNLIQTHGITVVVATGNSQIDACQITPANVNGTIAVAASDLSNKFNAPGSGDYELIYEYDNTGKCVDVFAPGVDIMAACGGAGRCTPLNDRNYAWASGTSMAVPHVAGAAAIYLGQYPNATPAQVSHAITGASITGLLNADGMLPGTPNKLLFVNPNSM